jgi:hypothetical protein
MDWKLVSILLAVLLVIETAFIVHVYNVGMTEINNENKCAVSCQNGYDTYSYESGWCGCYINHVLMNSTLMS